MGSGRMVNYVFAFLLPFTGGKQQSTGHVLKFFDLAVQKLLQVALGTQ